LRLGVFWLRHGNGRLRSGVCMFLWLRHGHRRTLWLGGFSPGFRPIARVLSKVKANFGFILALCFRVVFCTRLVTGLRCGIFHRYTTLTRLARGIQQGKAAWWFLTTFDSNLNRSLDWFTASLGRETQVLTLKYLVEFTRFNAFEECF